MNRYLVVTALTAASVTSTAQAFVVDCRWTYNLSTSGAFTPMPLGGLQNHDPSANPFVRLRLEFQVSGAGADGGFIGWNVGTLLAEGDCCESLARTEFPRRAPFNFLPNGNGASNPPMEPVPCGATIMGIDATQGFQTPIWECAPDGTPLPMPLPAIRGLSSFVSVYEVTLNLRAGVGTATVTAGGNALAASQWFTIGEPTPPDCGDPLDPLDDVPGSVVYAPTTPPPMAFTCIAQINCIPTPGGAAMLAVGGGLVMRRRRR